MNDIEIITIGKKLIDVAKEKKIKSIAEYSELHLATLSTISHDLVTYITSSMHKYSQVTIVSNLMKSFFVQKPHQTQIVPFSANSTNLGSSTED